MIKNILGFLSLAILMGAIVLGVKYAPVLLPQVPEEGIRTAFEGVKTQNREIVTTYFGDTEVLDAIPALFGIEGDYTAAILSDFTYEVVNVERKGSSVQAWVVISNRDFRTAYDACILENYTMELEEKYKPEPQQMTETQLVQAQTDRLKHMFDNRESLEMRNTQVFFNMEQQGKTWLIQSTPELSTAICGGLLTSEEHRNQVVDSQGTEIEAGLKASYDEEIAETDKHNHEIAHYVVEEIWNDTICNMISTIRTGEGLDEEAYDLEEGMLTFTQQMDELTEADGFINGLNRTMYNDIKASWNSFYLELTKLYEDWSSRTLMPEDTDYVPDVTELKTQMDTYVAVVYPEDGALIIDTEGNREGNTEDTAETSLESTSEEPANE